MSRRVAKPRPAYRQGWRAIHSPPATTGPGPHYLARIAASVTHPSQRAREPLSQPAPLSSADRLARYAAQHGVKPSIVEAIEAGTASKTQREAAAGKLTPAQRRRRAKKLNAAIRARAGERARQMARTPADVPAVLPGRTPGQRVELAWSQRAVASLKAAVSPQAKRDASRPVRAQASQRKRSIGRWARRRG